MTKYQKNKKTAGEKHASHLIENYYTEHLFVDSLCLNISYLQYHLVVPRVRIPMTGLLSATMALISSFLLFTRIM